MVKHGFSYISTQLRVRDSEISVVIGYGGPLIAGYLERRPDSISTFGREEPGPCLGGSNGKNNEIVLRGCIFVDALHLW